MFNDTQNSSKVPFGYCECGCGRKTAISSKTYKPHGHVKGKPKRFIRGHANKGKVKQNLTGKRFGRWYVIKLSNKEEGSRTNWLCRCDCGTERIVQGNHLKSGKSVSCGCYAKEVNSEKATTHGMSKHPLYSTWVGMKARCNDPKHDEYHNYGGRGITVCDKWQDSFKSFYDDMGERPNKKTLDRIDNDGPYSPENCRWATAAQQHKNSRVAHLITFKGETRTLYEWAVHLGMRPTTLNNRINTYKWSIKRALTEPINKNCHHKSK